MDHHHYDNLTKAWRRAKSKPQPTITLTVKAIEADFTEEALGPSYKLSANKTVAVNVLADTGCQSSLAGTNLLQKLGLSTSDLIPVSTKMRSASN